jgi:hypothetical protein
VCAAALCCTVVLLAGLHTVCAGWPAVNLQAPLPHPVGSTDTPGPRPPTNPYVSNGLRIRGNVFINNATDGSLGLEACLDSNAACNTAQVGAAGLKIVAAVTFQESAQRCAKHGATCKSMHKHTLL